MPADEFSIHRCCAPYVCKGYHRNGKDYCSPHRIHEEKLDAAVWDYLTERRNKIQSEITRLAQLQKMWALRKPLLDAHISALQGKIERLELEIDEIVMEKILQSQPT